MNRIRSEQSSEKRLDGLLSAMSDQTRRAIILRLVQGEARVTEIAEPFGMSLNAVSKHIRVLEESGLLHRRINGREHFLSVNIEALDSVEEWLRKVHDFWEGRLDALETLLRRRRHSEKDRKDHE